MISGLFESTTIPLLEQVVSFAQARHTVLAGNIANIDTPGYQARDFSVEDFQERLKAALAEQKSPSTMSPGEPDWKPVTPLAEVAKKSQLQLKYELENVGVEQRASAMAKNQMQHNLALSLLIDQFRLLESAVSEKV
jgi:flagellar basal-body rod protein FlgB